MGGQRTDRLVFGRRSGAALLLGLVITLSSAPVVARPSTPAAPAVAADDGTIVGSGRYRLRDLGIPDSSALAVNEHNEVVGTFTQDEVRHAFLWTPEGGMTDLGTFGGPGAIPRSINKHRQVVGRVGGYPTRSWIWTAEDGMVGLGTLGFPDTEDVWVVVDEITDSGYIVGTIRVYSPTDPEGQWAFRIAPDGRIDTLGLEAFRPPPDIPKGVVEAEGATEDGTVWGMFLKTNGCSGITGDHRLFRWPVGASAPEYLTDKCYKIYDVNERGQVVGYDCDGDAYVYGGDSGIVPIPALAPEGLRANGAGTGVNRHQVVVGFSDTYWSSLQVRHAFAWHRSLGTLDLGVGGARSDAFEINDGGTVVGQHDGRATVWESLYTRFIDVPWSNPFADEIVALAEMGVTSGYEDGTFRPAAAIQRMAMASFLWRYEGQPSVALTEPYFADVPPDHPFYAAIQWMAASGLSTGTPNPAGGKPLYRPAEKVSRQAMAAFLWRHAGEPASGLSGAYFGDVTSASPFFAPIQWMAGSGLSTGTPNPPGKPSYRPADAVSRQAMAAFLYRYDQL